MIIICERAAYLLLFAAAAEVAPFWHHWQEMTRKNVGWGPANWHPTFYLLLLLDVTISFIARPPGDLVEKIQLYIFARPRMDHNSSFFII